MSLFLGCFVSGIKETYQTEPWSWFFVALELGVWVSRNRFIAKS